MYNVEQVKEFISILEESSLAVLELQSEDGAKIRLEKPQSAQQIVNTIPVANGCVGNVPSEAPTPAPEAAPQAAAPVENAKTINAPIVGVFYAAPAPDKDPYASVGKKMSKGDTVCIIEAMKCMNEIQAEENCEIVEVLVKDGELVEFGQPLFKVR